MCFNENPYGIVDQEFNPILGSLVKSQNQSWNVERMYRLLLNSCVNDQKNFDKYF